MKKILSLSLLLIAGSLSFTSCQSEEDDLFDSSAAERLAASKVTYAKLLPQATAGWVMEYYPTNGGSWPRGNGYLLLAKFNDDKSVDMASLNEEMTDGKYMEDTSLWEVIADQGPVLSFNTYNQCLHSFADPALYETGLGLEGDYEFEIINLQEGAQFAMLKGKKRGTYTRMTRLEEGTDFKEYLTSVTDFRKKVFDTTAPNNLLITLGDKKYIINNVADGFLSFYPEGGDAISETESHPYLITRRNDNYHLRFRDAFELEELEKSVQELTYDTIQNKFIGIDEETFVIEGYPVPLFVKESLDKGNKFQMTTASAKSEKFATLFENMRTGLSTTMKYTLNSIQVLNTTADSTQQATLGLRFAYRVRRGTQTVTQNFTINYDITYTADGFTLSNMNPGETGATVIEKVPELTAFANALATEFRTEHNGTPFNLSTVKIVSASDPETWFVLSYTN